ncbi:SRPBCC family protein [Rhodoferax sp.]|uniref:SRPBCC family protein n=1 Tax=Rhodoferax sp. TaxID=50421 RepID=UPI0027258A23|nr:SRPBCC family protein [Rhodoferax sp.]MDO9197652.1 SRPBCC family protein [Rhodoferax sp.]
MFTVSISEKIGRSPEAVFAFAGDYANDPLWRKGVLAMAYESSGPPGIGTRTRETMRSMGRTAVTVAEVTEYSTSRTAFRSLSGPVPCDGTREFVASGTGTVFTYSLTLRPVGFLRVLEPILKFVFLKQVRTDLRRLKLHLEAQA